MSARLPRLSGLCIALACSACGAPDEGNAELYRDEPAQGPMGSGAVGNSSADLAASSNASAATGSGGNGPADTTGSDSGLAPDAGSDASMGFGNAVRRAFHEVPGGSFEMGRSADGSDACPHDMDCLSDELPEHTVQVSGFALDDTEVTVAELREFVAAFAGPPPPGSGAHPNDPQSGWRAEYDDALPRTTDSLGAALACDAQATFTVEPGPNDELPINCVTWYEALAFCVSRGGRLPSEAEWEFAAAGGDENRLYPWGNDVATESRAAVYPSELTPVGSLEAGAGRWQHADLAGNVWEWVLDWLDPTVYDNISDDCVDCVSSAAGTHRGLRGGAFSFDASAARAAARSGDLPGERKRSIGFRCAYDD